MLTQRSLIRLSALVLPLVLLNACTTVDVEHQVPSPTTPQAPEKSKVQFSPASWQSVPTTESRSWASALAALKQSCRALLSQPAWSTVCRQAELTNAMGAETFFRTEFTPWQVLATTPGNSFSTGLMTGYYEPLLQGSRTRQGQYKYPLYGVPDDLIVVDLASLYPQLKGMRLRGKLQGRTLIPYDSREQIDKRTDLNRKAVAWVDDEIAAFFLQIQGSGRIRLPNGSMMRVGYADQNGHRYRGIGNVLIRNGELKANEASMQGIQAWARRNPSRVKAVLAQNPSYVFFQERPGDPNLGPQGSQGVPLTPEASVAVDRQFWKMGTVFLVSASQSVPKLAFTRPVVAQDTGDAIRGPIRFDYFWGFGDKAGRNAGRQKSEARAWVLVPRGMKPQDMQSTP